MTRRTRLDRKPAADTFEPEPRVMQMRTRVSPDRTTDDDGNSFSRSIRRRAEDAGTQSRADRDNHTGQFLTGNRLPPGRRPGQQNRITVLVKAAILGAAEQVGDPRDNNRGGLQGYLCWLAVTEPAAYTSLIKRLLPQQIRADASVAVGLLASLRTGTPLNGHAPVIEHQPSSHEDPDE